MEHPSTFNLVFDIGNTFAKLAVFKGMQLQETFSCPNSSLDVLPAVMSKYPISQGIVSSVIHLSDAVKAQLSSLPFPLLWLDYRTPLPITNLYRTPHTLGSDRLAAVVGAYYECPGRDLLVIDAGTCITYEFIDSSGCYHGGNISPGLQMRLSVLHQHTSRLPLVDASGALPPFGYDTDTAIRSGVIRGIEYEVRGYIEDMRSKYPGVLVFLTGGDGFSFDANIKSIIFADRFLVLKGLNRILDYNNDKNKTHS